jgi:hypothetical protein
MIGWFSHREYKPRDVVARRPVSKNCLLKGALLCRYDENRDYMTFSSSGATPNLKRGRRLVKKRKTAALLLLRMILSAGCVTVMGAQGLAAVDVPHATGTRVESLNDRGDVAGWFLDSSEAGKARGFIRDSHGDFTVFDVPNAAGTFPSSINTSVEVTGYFVDLRQNKQRGFVRDQSGKFSIFDGINATLTTARSINDGGDVTGDFSDAAGTSHGFVRDRTGTMTVFGVSASGTSTFGINARGDVTSRS